MKDRPRDPAPEEKSLPQGRPAPVRHPILPEIRDRWSPRAFSSRPVEAEALRTVFEAARWAPSSYNEQPWVFLVATRETPAWLERLGGYLVEANAWARRAPVLIATAYRTHLSRSGKPNPVSARDLGAAEQNLCLQAFASGLVVHQMAGFDRERVRDELLPEEGYAPCCFIALGHPGDPSELPDDLREKEGRERRRGEAGEFVFGERWGEPAAFLAGGASG